jgi:uncharacterized membrane protein
MDQIAKSYAESFLSWSTLLFIAIGFVLGLVNIKFNFVNRDKFFSKVIKWYAFGSAVIALPLIAGYLFGPDYLFLGALVLFGAGPLLLIFHPMAVSVVLGLLLATILRDLE